MKKVTNHKNVSGQATKAKILAYQFQSIVYVIQINQNFKHAIYKITWILKLKKSKLKAKF